MVEKDKLLTYNLKYESILELSTKIKVDLLKEELGIVIMHLSRTKKVGDLKVLINRDHGISMEKLLLKLGDVILDDESVLEDLVYEGDEIIK